MFGRRSLRLSQMNNIYGLLRDESRMRSLRMNPAEQPKEVPVYDLSVLFPDELSNESDEQPRKRKRSLVTPDFTGTPKEGFIPKRHRNERDALVEKMYTWSKQRSALKKFEHTITRKDIYDLLDKQQGRCVLSGIPFTYYTKKLSKDEDPTLEFIRLHLNNPSIDRIDSNKGYVKENIRLVSSSINVSRSDFPLTYFLHICECVWKHMKEKELGTAR